MPTQNVNLSDRQVRFIQNRVREGRFATASEVVRAGLRLLEQQEQQDKAKLKILRRLEKESVEQIEQGEYVEVGDIDSLDRFLEQIDANSRRPRQ